MNECFKSADILLPDFNKTDAQKWAVVACDQFTSEPEYWEKAEAVVGNDPSTLRLILPEVYLDRAKEKIPDINNTMKEYLDGVLIDHPDSMIFVERTQSDGNVRRGIVAAIDLECYEYTKGADALIRATEATVVERIPPRVAIRRDAVIELPHVMLLIDDPDGTVIEPLVGCCDNVAYDTQLMLGGGHIKGFYLDGEQKAQVKSALDGLITPEAMEKKYGDGGLAPLLFAVGDGNHSLASAKAAYEEIKTAIGVREAMSHPARYALVEVVNIHDEALKFEPIYRVMFGVDPEDVLKSLEKYAAELDGKAQPQKMTYIHGKTEGEICVSTPVRQLTVGTLQDFIDGYIKAHEGSEVDYIHGEKSTRTLAERDGAIGFLFDGMGKSELFRTVIFDGALPRKTFSMGHAEDKRYYMECRRIK